MTKLEALERMEEQHRRFVAALEALPDGADILHCLQSTEFERENYIQLYSNAELPDGQTPEVEAVERHKRLSVNLCGVKVLWLLEEEAQK